MDGGVEVTPERWKIDVTPSFSGTLTYTGSSQAPTWENYIAEKMDMGGDADGTDAGDYTTTFTPKEDYCWQDGSIEPVSIQWTINPEFVAVPAQSGTLTYTGAELSPTWSNYDPNKITLTGSTAETESGTYTVTFSVKKNYKWADGTSDDKEITWTIKKVTLTVPTQSGTLTYTGSAQSPAWNNYDSEKMTLAGSTSETESGSYTVTFTPHDNYQWADGTVEGKSVTWTINKASLTVPSQNGTLTYSGSSQTPSWSNYNSEKMTISGATSGTSAGSYTVKFNPAVNYQWSDGTTAEKSVTWTIGRATISTTPSQSGSLTYSGSSKSPSWSNYDSSKLTIGGTTSATSAGSYSATFTPKSDYQWSGGSTSSKSVTWNIGKASGSSSLNKSSLSLTSSSKTGTISVTRSGTGTVSATSSNTGVATVSVSGTTVTVTGVGNGSCTITVKVASSTNYTAPSNKTVSVSVSLASTTLNNNSWATISSVSASGQAANYWSVGDCKAVKLSGTVGTLSLNTTLYVYIIGFNHDKSSASGTANGITFGTFKTALSGGTDVGLYSSSGFSMNTTDTNSGGWKACNMRYNILGSTKTSNADASTTTATSPKSNTLMSCLPSDLRAVMKPMYIYTDNVGGGTNTASNVTGTIDYLPLLAESETIRTWGGADANESEYDYVKKYAYYSAGNGPIKYRHDNESVIGNFALRSPGGSRNDAFCFIGDYPEGLGGGLGYYSGTMYASRTMLISPIFKV